MIQKEIYQQVKRHPKFKELVDKRSSFALRLSFLILGFYFTFIMIIAFWPELFSTTIGSGVTTVGIPFGLFIILLCVVSTKIYIQKANNEFDKLTDLIKEDVRLDG
ncbi:DUF485 domain-containing protein [Sulfurospirillum sp. 1307]